MDPASRLANEARCFFRPTVAGQVAKTLPYGEDPISLLGFDRRPSIAISTEPTHPER
jgi:hypothetical protein